MKHKVQFVFVYILEAHASDTWPMGWSIEWPRPRSLKQRQDYAAKCISDLGLANLGMTILVDGMHNSFNRTFGSWPTAYYFTSADGVLLQIGEPDPGMASYDIERMLTFIEQYLTTKDGTATPEVGK
eukprot:c9315_g1_i2.p1 GENE.c9315_g1_i2~~c9315_g1_i2.p1  ORF type:complete len:127 (-),score=24.97 c9315_g1_i2:239-619(-)